MIIRGISGSGKSTLANIILDMTKCSNRTCVVCEADHYFMKEDKYNFHPSKLNAAHKYCQKRVLQSAKELIDVIVVSNTSTTNKEVDTYLKLALLISYTPIVVRKVVATEEAMKRCKYRGNNHTVPDLVVTAQANRIVDIPNEIIMTDEVVSGLSIIWET